MTVCIRFLYEFVRVLRSTHIKSSSVWYVADNTDTHTRANYLRSYEPLLIAANIICINHSQVQLTSKD